MIRTWFLEAGFTEQHPRLTSSRTAPPPRFPEAVQSTRAVRSRTVCRDYVQCALAELHQE